MGGLLAGIVIGGTWIGYGLSESSDYERQASTQAEKYARYTRDKVAEACVGIPSVESIKCFYDAIDAQQEYEYNQTDLVAQRQSALWAYIMAAAAIIGMILSAVGVWLVYGTWKQTAEAAESTRKTLRSYVAKERALLGLNRAEHASNPESQREGFVVKLINGGLAPAIITRTSWSYLQQREWPDTFDHSDSSKRTLAPDGDGRTPLLYWPKDLMGYWPFLVGVIEYETLNERYMTPFSFRLTHHAADEYGPSKWTTEEISVEGMPEHT